jgi:exoribonuclease R
MENKPKMTKFEESILRIFTLLPYSPLNSRQIAARLGSPDKQSRDIIYKTLNKLADAGLVARISKEKFKFNPTLIPSLTKDKFAIGFVNIKLGKKIYVDIQDTGEEIFIRNNFSLNACHQDRVKVFLFPPRGETTREGQIVEVLQRVKTTFVGTLRLHQNGEWYLKCDSIHVPFKIHISKEKMLDLPEYTKALVKVTDWNEDKGVPEGEILQDFGKAGGNEAEMMTILSEYNFPFKFSEKTIAEVRKLSEDKEKFNI